MIRKEKSLALKFLVMIVLVIPIINYSLIFVASANTNYTIALEKGTQILEVKKYDEQTWQNTVSINSTPSNWFGGEANKIGAKSKITLFDWWGNEILAFTLFRNFISQYIFSNVSNYGYNYSYLHNNYPDSYRVWGYNYHYWAFTTKEFNYNPDKPFENLFFPENTQDFSPMLEDYNDFAGKINNDTTLQLLGYSFPILSGDDLLWQFIVGRFAIGTPVNDYLTTFTDTIGDENVTIQDNTLVLQRGREKNYNVEVTYNTQGLIDKFVVKNSEGYIFYEITSFYPKTIFYVILGLLAIFGLGIVVLVIVKKIKINKQFK